MGILTHLISYEDSLLMPESNLEEVIDGELHVKPPATRHHGSLVRCLQRIFDRQMRDCFDLVQGTGFLLRRSPLRYRIPDLAIVDRADWQRDLRTTEDPYSHVVPALVIEIISSANRKGAGERLLENYAEFGIPEVLFFHPESRTYESYAGVELIDSARTGTVTLRTMPEVSIDLDQLWEEF
jgi:hypothetical protein